MYNRDGPKQWWKLLGGVTWESYQEAKSESDKKSYFRNWQKKVSLKYNFIFDIADFFEMNPPEGQQSQGDPGAQGLRLIIQACQKLYPQQPNPLQV